MSDHNARRFAAAMLLTCVPASLWPSCAVAHKPSDSYLALSVQGDTVAGQWDIALRDLDFAIGLDANGNGEITWGEVKAKHKEIAAYALARLAIALEGAACPAAVVSHLADNHSDGAYAVLRFAAACPGEHAELEVTYRLFSDIDPQHKGLLRLDAGGQTRTAIFSPENARQTFDLASPSIWKQFSDYLASGMEHIWAGYDHILFLLSLLLPSVLVRCAKGWEPVKRFRSAFVDILKIVTAFTVAHSITLSLSTLQIVTLPARISESAIAMSVVLAALNNLFPIAAGKRWLVAFGFGLIHGFGFANVLTDLGLPGNVLILALVGFNLGVEAGQLAIVGVFLPLAYFLRRTWFYRHLVLTGGSFAIVMVASLWFVERAFDLKFFPLWWLPAA
ncbi:MAG: HupE/UreJ family protein [Beijerinckiaceae bacterium]|nr:HupE/UreJ family protein [Beijerinckiaceae bacterium]